MIIKRPRTRAEHEDANSFIERLTLAKYLAQKALCEWMCSYLFPFEIPESFDCWRKEWM